MTPLRGKVEFGLWVDKNSILKPRTGTDGDE
jgi:hypothetical protein